MKSQISHPSASAVVAIVLACCTLPIALPHPAAAQQNPALTNVIPESEAVTFHAKIQEVDMNNRQVTLVGRGGRKVTVVAAPNVNLNNLNPEQVVNAKYYRSVAFLVSPKMNPPEDQMKQILAQPAQAPGGIPVTKIEVSGLVVGIDLAAHSVDVVNPTGGAVYTLDVTDPARIAMLSQLKVGDTVTAVISQAMLVSVEPAPRSWF
jgi:hypothetical protein